MTYFGTVVSGYLYILQYGNLGKYPMMPIPPTDDYMTVYLSIIL